MNSQLFLEVTMLSPSCAQEYEKQQARLEKLERKALSQSGAGMQARLEQVRALCFMLTTVIDDYHATTDPASPQFFPDGL